MKRRWPADASGSKFDDVDRELKGAPVSQVGEPGAWANLKFLKCGEQSEIRFDETRSIRVTRQRFVVSREKLSIRTDWMHAMA